MGILEAFGRGWVDAGREHAARQPHGNGDARRDVGAEDSESDSELAEARATILELQELVEALKARAELFGEILLLPGVKRHLMRVYHPDANPTASEADRRAHEETCARINAAFELLENKR